MSNEDAFRRITSALDRAGIAYMLTGSFASVHYGAPRATQDIDIVVEAEPAVLKSFIESLGRDQFYADIDSALEAQRRESMFNVIDRATGWKIDLIIRKSRAFSKEEFGRRCAVDLEGIRIFVASAEDIVIAKLEWAKQGKSQRQIDDVATILRLRRDALDHSYMDKWISALELGEQWRAARLAAGMSV
jgi:hypothetical protein